LNNRDFQRQLSDFNDPTIRQFSLTRILRIDFILLMLLSILAVFGLIVLYSAADKNISVVIAQLQKYALALFVMLVIAQIPPRFYQRLSPIFYTLIIIFLIAVLLVGTDVKGAQRWLSIPGLPRFQPSELMKLFMPMMLAWFLSERPLPPKNKHVFIALGLIFVPALLILKQPDLGTALLIASSGCFIVFLAGISLRIITAFFASAIVALPLLWFFYMHDYQKQRVLTFLNPELDPHGSGWNIIQSKIAIGSGGLTGKGWMDGTQSHLDFLPESTTDFIIAVLAEEFGFLGVLLLLTLYLLIIIRGIKISLEAQSSYNRLLAGSIILTFFVYVFVNIGMVSGILPVVGVPLPLISVGGTSLLSMFAGFGILMSIHSHKNWLSH